MRMEIKTPHGPARGHLHAPADARALLVLGRDPEAVAAAAVAWLRRLLG